jgi:methionyl-tRNA formyltransferase
MRLVFFGSSEFGVPALTVLRGLAEVAAVVTTGEKPKGRGLALQPSPIKLCARELGLPVLEPDDPNSPEFIGRVRSVAPDLIVLAAYRFILKPDLLAVPSRGSLNLHPSLLPRYRGAAPVQRALMNGETETGVSLFLMNEQIDRGDVVLQRAVPVGVNETCGELSARLAEMSALMLREALPRIESGSCPRVPQDPGLASYAPKIKKEERLVQWTRPAQEVHNLVRALSPAPAAFSFLRGRRLELLGSELLGRSGGSPQRDNPRFSPGVLTVDGRHLICSAGNGDLLLTRVKPEGGKTITGTDLINGHRVRTGERLTEAP